EAALLRSIRTADENDDGSSGWIARHRLGRRWLDAGRVDEARVLLDEALERLEGVDEGLDPLGEGLYVMRGRSNAYVDAARAARDDPDRIWDIASKITGRALRGQGVLDEAPPLTTVRAQLAADEAILLLLDGDPGLSMLVHRDGVRVESVPGFDDGALGSGSAALTDALPFCSPFHSRIDPSALAICPAVDAAFGSLRSLSNTETIWIVPTGIWTRWPFAAMPWHGGSRFGERFAYAILPTTGHPPAANRGASIAAVHLLGPPTFSVDDEWAPLPFAAREVSRLAEIWGERARVVSGDALRPAVLDALDDAPVGLIHLATHAVASTTDPRDNGIVLSDAERYGLDAVLQRRLSGATVVLSACRTADGERVPGQGRLGLAWAFQLAGASWVVATHDAVDDEATSEAMVAFHRALQEGHDPPQALRRVRRAFSTAGRSVQDTSVLDVYGRPR
ncbi:MAG: CHAT domain-containing protein, partial [Planctomycetota bacterium]|nr:CHAT domain-containing protein [Planctomycetota bacterium]